MATGSSCGMHFLRPPSSVFITDPMSLVDMVIIFDNSLPPSPMNSTFTSFTITELSAWEQLRLRISSLLISLNLLICMHSGCRMEVWGAADIPLIQQPIRDLLLSINVLHIVSGMKGSPLILWEHVITCIATVNAISWTTLLLNALNDCVQHILYWCIQLLLLIPHLPSPSLPHLFHYTYPPSPPFTVLTFLWYPHQYTCCVLGPCHWFQDRAVTHLNELPNTSWRGWLVIFKACLLESNQPESCEHVELMTDSFGLTLLTLVQAFWSLHSTSWLLSALQILLQIFPFYISEPYFITPCLI